MFASGVILSGATTSSSLFFRLSPVSFYLAQCAKKRNSKLDYLVRKNNWKSVDSGIWTAIVWGGARWSTRSSMHLAGIVCMRSKHSTAKSHTGTKAKKSGSRSTPANVQSQPGQKAPASWLEKPRPKFSRKKVHNDSWFGLILLSPWRWLHF